METVIIVHKGLHPDNYTLIDDIQKNINKPQGWFTLGIVSLADENKDLDVTVHANHNYIEQGVFFLFDAFKHVNKNENLIVNFKRYSNNGDNVRNIDDIAFTYKDDEMAVIVVECARTADAVHQTLKTIITVYRSGNKRTITLTNEST